MFSELLTDTYSASVRTLEHSEQTLTWNSWPRDGRVDRLELHESQIAFPHFRQWCCRRPTVFWSYIALKFQKNGLEQFWQKSDSAHSGVCFNDTDRWDRRSKREKDRPLSASLSYTRKQQYNPRRPKVNAEPNSHNIVMSLYSCQWNHCISSKHCGSSTTDLWPCSSYVVPFFPPMSQQTIEQSYPPENSICLCGSHFRHRIELICPFSVVISFKLLPSCFNIRIWPFSLPTKAVFDWTSYWREVQTPQSGNPNSRRPVAVQWIKRNLSFATDSSHSVVGEKTISATRAWWAG